MSYQIFGQKVLNEYLALGTMGLTGGIAYLASSGESKPKPAPVAAAGSAEPSKEENEFIQNFVAEFEKSEKEGK